MNLAAISHRATSQDCFCLEPGRFLFRIRTAQKDIAKIILHHQDKYLPLKLHDTRQEKVMALVTSDGRLDYWAAELEFDVVCLRYWFELVGTDGTTIYYSNYRFASLPFTDTDDMFDCPQNLREEEAFVTPRWAENKVIYQIFPSRFASTEPVPKQEWYKAPISFQDDLHGNLRGIIRHLDDLKELGVDVIYMTPIFRSDSCHKYDTIDYYQIDPSFGTKADLLELVEKAHERGMYVILDAVFNHTSRDFFAFADIMEKGRDSKYIDWYFIQGFPLRYGWGEKPNFKTFSYYGGMPKLNVKNPEVARYLLDVALYWLRECHIDGWRLDVGDEISHRFWRTFRSAIKSQFPEALVIGEVWHQAEDFLQGDEWDTVMNYPFYQSVLRLVAEESITVSEFANNFGFQKGNLHPKVLPLLWNLIDSHDTPRLLHQCGGRKDKMRLVAALQLLFPGMPMIYYGDEYAMDGGQDPDCRRGMAWDAEYQDEEMYQWYRSLLRLRRECPDLLTQDCTTVTDDAREMILRKTPQHTLLLHCRDGQVDLPEYAGTVDLISGNIFDGTLPGFAAVLL